jgi:hypothetical protein
MDTQTGCALFVKVSDRADMWRVRTSLSTIDGLRTSPTDCQCWRRTSFGNAIVVLSAPASLAAAKATTTIPIIFMVSKGLAKTIRAMADGTLDSQVGARICNGLGIMRACLETQKLEQLEARMDEIADRVAHERTGAARERTSTHEAQRL